MEDDAEDLMDEEEEEVEEEEEESKAKQPLDHEVGDVRIPVYYHVSHCCTRPEELPLGR